MWPSHAWPPLVLRDGLAPGSGGGHGPMRYAVTGHEPGRRITFAFDPAAGLVGRHEFRISPHGDGHTLVVHTIEARKTGRMRLLWPLALRWFHEALVHDLFDNLERAVVGSLAGPPSRWPRRVVLLRNLHRTLTPSPRVPTAGGRSVD